MADVVPSNVKISCDNKTLTISWYNIPTVRHYRVQRLNGTTWNTITTQVASTYSDTGLTNGTSYSYRILLSFDDETWSAPSEVVTGIPTAVPQDFTATAENGYIVLKWKAVSGATQYRIQRLNNDTWTTIASPTTNEYINTGLTNGTAYSYRVLSYTDSWSGASEIVTATPFAADCYIVRRGGKEKSQFIFTMSDNGNFQYPENFVVPKNVTIFSPSAASVANHNEIKKVSWDYGSAMTEISQSAFVNCKGLTDITIPSNIAVIRPSAFNGCSALKNITLESRGENGITVYSSAFRDCTELTTESANAITTYIKKSGTNISTDYLFYNCKAITNIVVSTLGLYMFQNCTGLKTVTVDMSYMTNGISYTGSFIGCSALTKVQFINGTTDTKWCVSTSMFEGCSTLTTLTIPHGVTRLGNKMCKDCTSLTKAWLPNTVTSGANATGTSQLFYNCPALSDIQLESGWNCALVVTDVSLTAQSLKAMFESLADLTGTTAKTLTLGTDNYNKAIATKYTPTGSTAEVSIATIATNKNWTLQT